MLILGQKSCFLRPTTFEIPHRTDFLCIIYWTIQVLLIFLSSGDLYDFLNKISKSEKLAVKCICQGELSDKPLALFCQNQFCPATFHFIFNKQTICCAWQIHVLHCKFLPHENTGTGNHMVPAGKTCTSHKNMKIPGKNNLLFISYKN